MNTYHLAILSAIIAISAAAENVWTGPLSNHVLGELVEDTPEVAEAKRHHAAFFAQVRSILPELPPEENDIVNPQVPNFHQYVHPVVTTYRPSGHFTVPPVTPPPVPYDPFNTTPVPWTGPLADHKLGQLVRETPEVALARKRHEEVISRVRATLPQLPVDVEERIPDVHARTQQVQDYDVAAAQLQALMEQIALLQKFQAQGRFTTTTTRAPQVQSFNWNSPPAETPEVAAARAAHSRALAAFSGR